MDLFSFLLGKKMGGGSPSPSTNKFAPTRLCFYSTDWYKIPDGFWEGFDNKNLTDISYLFFSNKNLKFSANLDLSFLDGTKPTNVSYMFHNAEISNLTNIDKLDLSEATNLKYAFAFTSVSGSPYWGDESVVINVPNGKDCSWLFYNSSGTIIAYPSKNVVLNVDYPTNLSRAFENKDVESVVINTKSTKDLTDLSYITVNVGTKKYLKSFKITSTETSSGNCSLSEAFREPSTTNNSDHYLTSCDLSGLFGKSANISSIFRDCRVLQELDLRGIILTASTSNCTYAFYNCVSLQKLNICNFKMSNLTSAPNNFITSVPTDCTIIVKDEDEVAWWNRIYKNTDGTPTYSNVRVATDEEKRY